MGRPLRGVHADMSAAERSKRLRREREPVALFRGWGLRADRVPLSGAMKNTDGTAGHDVDVFAPWRDAPFIGEAKGSRRIPAWRRGWLGELG